MISTHLTLWHYAAITLLGTFAGVINIMAGGGSNLILPVLMMFGIPPDIANGSNRVGVFLQSIAGVHGFIRAKKIPSFKQTQSVVIPTLLGGIVGSVAASVLPTWLLKPLLLMSMLSVATLVLFKPNLFQTQTQNAPKPISGSVLVLLFVIGIYGGFVQAGVGLLMLPIFAGILGYNMLHANALKLICTLMFTAAAFFVFLLQGQIWWAVGLSLALGNTIGAIIGVKLALRIPAHFLRWLIFIMTLVAVTIALFK